MFGIGSFLLMFFLVYAIVNIAYSIWLYHKGSVEESFNPLITGILSYAIFIPIMAYFSNVTNPYFSEIYDEIRTVQRYENVEVYGYKDHVIIAKDDLLLLEVNNDNEVAWNFEIREGNKTSYEIITYHSSNPIVDFFIFDSSITRVTYDKTDKKNFYLKSLKTN